MTLTLKNYTKELAKGELLAAEKNKVRERYVLSGQLLYQD